MKSHPLFALLAGLLLFAGCDSISDMRDSVREKVAKRDEGRSKVYNADARATFEAVRAAARQMGYRILRAGAAQGELEAVNAIAADDALRGSRQFSMKVKVHGSSDGTTEVAIRLTEIIEANPTDAHASLPTETPLRDTPQYQVFFRNVQEALSAPKG